MFLISWKTNQVGHTKYTVFNFLIWIEVVQVGRCSFHRVIESVTRLLNVGFSLLGLFLFSFPFVPDTPRMDLCR